MLKPAGLTVRSSTPLTVVTPPPRLAVESCGRHLHLRITALHATDPAFHTARPLLPSILKTASISNAFYSSFRHAADGSLSFEARVNHLLSQSTDRHGGRDYASQAPSPVMTLLPVNHPRRELGLAHQAVVLPNDTTDSQSGCFTDD